MKHVLPVILLLLTTCIAAGATVNADDSGAEQIFIAHAVHADVGAGIRALDGSDPDSDLRRIVGYRFDKRPQSTNVDVLDRIDYAYRLYWHRALLAPEWRWLHALALKATLYHTLRDAGNPTVDVGAGIEALLQERGVGSITQKSMPLLDFIAWKTQRKSTYEVPLSDAVESVNVVFISDLVSHGWMDYATMGKVATGGWVAPEGIYCLEEQYDTSSEEFRVSFLQHEARHQADLKKNPRISPLMLEYRAKLTELVNAERTLSQIVSAMEERADGNGATVHARADHKVTIAMRDALGCGEACPALSDFAMNDPSLVKRAAHSLLMLSAP